MSHVTHEQTTSLVPCLGLQGKYLTPFTDPAMQIVRFCDGLIQMLTLADTDT